MTLVYADSDDLAAWTGTDAPGNATVLLRSASILVRDATISALYETDDDGYPTDTDVLQAFNDATCAHAAALDAADVNPLAAGTQAGISSTAIGGASISYAGADAAASVRLDLSRSLCQEALRILHHAGMLSMPPSSYQG
jgi:hypothetical protein